MSFAGGLARQDRFSLIVACIALLASVAPRPAFSATTFPDWVMQAAGNKSTNYPAGSKAAILYEEKFVSVGPDGHAVERQREVIKILRPQGREYARIIAWYSKGNRLNSFHAWSIAPDGHQYTVKDDQVRDIGADDVGMLYIDVRAKVVTVPGGDPGAIVAYEVERQLSSYGTGEEDWTFQGTLPTDRAVFEIDLPAGWKDYTGWLHYPETPAAQPAPNHWRWELHNIPAIDLTDVPLAPAEAALAGRMVVHYAAGELPSGDQRWAEIGNWYDSLAAARTEAPLEVAAKSREVADRAADFTTKIRAVAGFMQREIRYVGIEIGIGGLQPHPAAEVFHNRYGDCKDKATLLIAMLNAVGVRATWVLVDTRRGVIDPGLPSIRGNHAIAAIEIPAGTNDASLRALVTARSGKRYLIFDPTDAYTPIGLLRSELQGSYGILVAGKDSQVIALPKLDPDASTMERAAHFELDADGTLKGKVTEVRAGETGRSYRRLYAQEGEKDRREYMEHRLQRDLASFTLESSDARNTQDMASSVLLDFAFTANQYAKSAGELLVVRPRVLGRNSEALDDEPRTAPIELPDTGTWRDTVELKLPAGYEVDDLPAAVSVDVGFASYKSEIKAGAGTLHYAREYVVRQLELSPDKYDALKKLMGIIASDENGSAVLKKK